MFHEGKYSNQERHPLPQIVLLDLNIPKISGLEVLEKLKKSDQTKKVLVIILTTSNMEQDMTKAFNFNADSYLVKPANYEKFKEMMNMLPFYCIEQEEK